jgi:ABC-type bacteriocin/lantibiotic exporter with double-glycine peptidase domain
LDALPHGDQTHVGEKGVTLSGGQKARVALARAVYSAAEILLLDDIFSAVDLHVGEKIWLKCLKEFCGGRTIIMATHSQAFIP